ncbi:MAG: DUF1080 domain-containing protein [Pirellulaceae bacterium]|nr:DUF1080 domain-containing protein [Pirellulaceae bacterium]
MSHWISRVSFFSIISLLTALPALSQEPAASGWTDLFNGKNFTGWKHDPLGKAEYTIVDGAIHGKTVEGSPNSFLYTEKEYGDFELDFEVRVHDDLNSGVQIRSREKSEADVDAEAAKTGKAAKNKNAAIGRFHGPQVEIMSSPGKAGYIYGEATGYGWLSKEPQDAKHTHTAMKNGEWNKFRVVAKGPRIQTWINGQTIADLNHEGIYQTHPRGHIAVQVHGIKAGSGPYDVSWRNLRIRELK